MSKDQHPRLDWQGDVPVAQDFDDPYFSLSDGLAETTHVFLAGNGLPARFGNGFHIAELGFGTGLNCFAALAAWREKGCRGQLLFTSFERFPMETIAMRRALGAYPELLKIAEPVLDALSAGQQVIVLPDLELTLVTGDARQTLPKISDQVDCWFLDGFAPAKNPELWEPALLSEVAARTKSGGTFATYTAAGAVRRALADAGFEVERRSGFGRKRHMTVGHKP